MAGEYNYTQFPLDMDAEAFEAFRLGPRLGDKAPDGEVIEARDGSTSTLSALWKRGLLVLEFGSFT